jgi:adenylylsulfate kinase
MKRTLVFWFTGLSGSGKTTIAEKVARKLSKRNKKVKIYDGDTVRKLINKNLTFKPKDILKNNRIVAELCLKSTGKYDYILVPMISPFHKARELARKILKSSFFLVYVEASLQEVISRDPKGLYQKALVGEIKNFIGLDKNVPYEIPKRAHLVLNTETNNISASVSRFVKFVNLIEKSS